MIRNGDRELPVLSRQYMREAGQQPMPAVCFAEQVVPQEQQPDVPEAELLPYSAVWKPDAAVREMPVQAMPQSASTGCRRMCPKPGQPD